ncbi:Murein DD-endopeptidase MepM and murein hydrolase activator NlpD, contain LysM domain [Thermosyntropha lipolytica DSM 11003]|uniref:Murein DD-endopeptidase MepM and murein hydrolase activator NlpD, contain LysM domain n=2 Tax=Thermosyntropha TaxID=54293 RepID=A0A1M5QUZ5_9FIRM|nr:Murein DD-endopeptidase MepM and murein hydrolase activator NlpD, contain LysM domain [Thermosyntropha lipolytica DSM 11003]
MTILFIPPGGSQARRFNISYAHIKGLAAGMFLVVALLLTLGGLYFYSQDQIRQVDKLKADNKEKAEAIMLLQQEIESIEKQKEDIERKQEEIKKLMGIKETSGRESLPSRGGQGGRDASSRENVSDILYRLQDIKNYLSREEQALDEMLALAKNKEDYFRSVPNQWPVKGEITSPFGFRKSPFGGRRETFHEGIDIANNVGETIVAAADGKVVFAGWQPVYGKTVEIEHGYGFTTIYGHNSALLVKEGEVVRKGQPIARLGNTGRSTGPHLHFTVKKYGELKDPLIYLP